MAPSIKGSLVDPYDPALLAVLSYRLGRLAREVLLVVFLDGCRGYICDEILCIGGPDAMRSRYRPLIQRAFYYRAAALLLVHNHPSGNPRPSLADLSFTKALQVLARALDIDLADHLVVTRSAAYSILLDRQV